MSLAFGWAGYGFRASDDGAARGYQRTAAQLRLACAHDAGVKWEDVGPRTPKARVVLHVCPPHLFRPVPLRWNVLFSMWETRRLPPGMVQQIRQADRHVVPSRFCAETWAADGLRADVVPLGVDARYLATDASRLLIRTNDSPRLRLLAVGSRINRKGWDLLANAWEAVLKALGGGLDVELYVKTIGDGTTRAYCGGRLLFDQRDFSDVDMLRLYEEADIYVTGSRGEGFGLPALEAMATGCLVVAPALGGLREFVSPATAVVVPCSLPATIDYGVVTEAMLPDVPDLAAAMLTAIQAWGTPAAEQVRLQGARVARRFTWSAAGRGLARVLSELEGEVARVA